MPAADDVFSCDRNCSRDPFTTRRAASIRCVINFPSRSAMWRQLWESAYWPERASKNLGLEAAPSKIDRAVVRRVAIDVNYCRQCSRIRDKCQCNQPVHLLDSPR